MRIYWWQGGLHIEPESNSDTELLVVGYDLLHCLRIGHEVVSSPTGSIQGGYKEPVINTDEVSEIVT